MILLEHVSKVYYLEGRPNRVIDDLDFVFERGKSVAILGDQGAGRSTLMRLLAGKEQPTSGRIRRISRVAWSIGLGGFSAKLTGVENAKFACRIYGREVKPVLEYINHVTGLGEALEKPMRSYTREMRNRFALGVSLGMEFDFYLIDELATSSESWLMKRCEAELKERFKTCDMILVSQNEKYIRQYCTHGVILNKGKLSNLMPVEDALAQLNRAGGI